MSSGFSIVEEQLFEKTGVAVFKRLQRTSHPGDLLAVLRSAHRGFDRAYAVTSAEARASVACRAGCDACCHVPVGAQAHEVLLVAEYIQTHFTAVELEAAIARTFTHRVNFSGRTLEERAALQSPCILLKEGSCSVYPARPEACRSHHSHNASGCRSNLETAHGNVDVLIPEIHGRMFAVMLGIDQAVAEAGFDGRAYDFGSALHEALTDGLCAVRWMRKQPTFTESCWEAGQPDDPADAGVIRAEGFFR